MGKRRVEVEDLGSCIDVTLPECNFRFKTGGSFKRFKQFLYRARIVGNQKGQAQQSEHGREWYALATMEGTVALHHFSKGKVDVCSVLPDASWSELCEVITGIASPDGVATPVRPKRRKKVGEFYKEENGENVQRGSSEDFATLDYRHIHTVQLLSGFMEDDELKLRMGDAGAQYTAGEYADALENLVWCLERSSSLVPFLFYYAKVCARVLESRLRAEDLEYEESLHKYRSLPRWLKWTMPGFEKKVRCKWCGAYTQYVSPSTPTFGFDSFANSCSICERMYPMPSWLWDSPDGRCYSYYRMSFSDEVFYEEFEEDYLPDPLCERRIDHGK